MQRSIRLLRDLEQLRRTTEELTKEVEDQRLDYPHHVPSRQMLSQTISHALHCILYAKGLVVRPPVTQRSQVVDVYAHNEHTVLAQSSTNTKQQI